MSGEGFLGRWSRRKRAATAEAGLVDPVVPSLTDGRRVGPPAGTDATTALAGDASSATPAAADPPFDPARLPNVDTLTATSDIRDFLRPEVPAALRQAALRRAWALDPTIADFIGPADYAWDFNAPDGMAGFAPTLAGDVGRLFAQAIGLGDRPPAATPAVQASVEGSPGTLPASSAVIDGPATTVADLPRPASEAVAPAASPPPSTASVSADGPVPASVGARWRHGGAAPV